MRSQKPKARIFKNVEIATFSQNPKTLWIDQTHKQTQNLQNKTSFLTLAVSNLNNQLIETKEKYLQTF